ncbi:alpha/beta hydrolase [Cecembia rubra]|uniref:Phospholipase/carboxylesterase n=1 Tax=Cecembia rubra TaxID=1485585 RepID=A0A2P8E807_9BACT|nr:alpha/beta hydrolase [Cecembia rubra]PSL05538.1 phospholipase/carboxylesterase [Cecembia rubra]
MPETILRGKPLEEAKKVAVMVHGRGGNTASILGLADYLHLDDFALVAPQAPGNTWYPYSFMAPDKSNEPSFSNSLKTLDGIVEDLKAKGFDSEQVFFIGFSQGACLSLEYTAQKAQKWGGVIAFTGGLIGEQFNPSKYGGDFDGCPVFFGSSYQDMHVPLSRIEESALQFEKMGANVKKLIFPDTNHTIRQEEIDWVNENILK